jgi:hypothetical protein
MNSAADSAIQTFLIEERITVHAPIERTFASVLAHIGRLNETPDGKPLPMVIEPHPGGRWYRDQGDGNGHLWGFVQSIRRPTLLEIWGPLFMSTGATSNLMYRLSDTADGTLITFTHRVVGPFPEEHRRGVNTGWSALHARIRAAAEAAPAEEGA